MFRCQVISARLLCASGPARTSISGKIAPIVQERMATRPAVRGGSRQETGAREGSPAKKLLPISAPTMPCVMVSIRGAELTGSGDNP